MCLLARPPACSFSPDFLPLSVPLTLRCAEGSDHVTCVLPPPPRAHRTDTQAEIDLARRIAGECGASDAVACHHWERGGRGSVELARAVSKAASQDSHFRFLYELQVRRYWSDWLREGGLSGSEADNIVTGKKRSVSEYLCRCIGMLSRFPSCSALRRTHIYSGESEAWSQRAGSAIYLGLRARTQDTVEMNIPAEEGTGTSDLLVAEAQPAEPHITNPCAVLLSPPA